jgi:hypothetical protein
MTNMTKYGNKVLDKSVCAGLIGDWAERVIGLWEESRVPMHTVALEGLSEACRVRDQLNNRLTRPHPGAEETPGTLRVLRSADALFKQFTVQSTSAAALSHHDHYARRSEWWWGRLPFATQVLAQAG